MTTASDTAKPSITSAIDAAAVYENRRQQADQKRAKASGHNRREKKLAKAIVLSRSKMSIAGFTGR